MRELLVSYIITLHVDPTIWDIRSEYLEIREDLSSLRLLSRKVSATLASKSLNKKHSHQKLGENCELRLLLRKLVYLAVALAASAIVSIYLTQQSSPTVVDDSDLAVIVEDTFEVERNELHFFDVELESNTTVNGYFEESSGMCVNFYVLDEANFPRMLADYNFSAIISENHVVKYNFTFTADQRGTYYFVFDNERLVDGDVCLDKVIMLKLYRDRERA